MTHIHTLTRGSIPPILNHSSRTDYASITFDTHDQRTVTLRHRELAWFNDITGSDGLFADRESIVYGILSASDNNCPATSDCPITHQLVLHVRRYDGGYYVRDLNLCILHDFDFGRIPSWSAPTFDEALQVFAQSTLASMQVNHPQLENYGVVVYDWPNSNFHPLEYLDGGVGTGADLVGINIPADRRLLTNGDAISWTDPSGISQIRFAMTPAPMAEPDPTPDTTDTTIDIEPELRANIERLEQMLRSRNDLIRSAKEVAARYTMSNSGCNDGKRQFLRDLGLHDDDEIDELFEREFTVTLEIPVAATVSISTTVMACSEDDARNRVDDDIDSYLDDSTIQYEMRHADIDYDPGGIEITYVEEA